MVINNTEKIIEEVENDIGKYLNMGPNRFPYVSQDGTHRIHRIADNVIKLEFIKFKRRE